MNPKSQKKKLQDLAEAQQAAQEAQEKIQAQFAALYTATKPAAKAMTTLADASKNWVSNFTIDTGTIYTGTIYKFPDTWTPMYTSPSYELPKTLFEPVLHKQEVKQSLTLAVSVPCKVKLVWVTEDDDAVIAEAELPTQTYFKSGQWDPVDQRTLIIVGDIDVKTFFESDSHNLRLCLGKL